MAQPLSLGVANSQHKDFDTLRPSRHLCVRPAEPGDLAEAATFAIKQLPSLTLVDLAAYGELLRFDGDMIQLFLRSNRIVGIYAMLFLNTDGLHALLTGTLDTQVPPKAMLARPSEKPAGIYNWFTACPGTAAAGFGNVATLLASDRYRRADLYARPASEGGRRIMRALGYRPIEWAAGDLFRYVRHANRAEAKR